MDAGVELAGDRVDRRIFEFSISPEIIAAVIAHNASASCGVIREQELR
jgi:hypothetical protein